MQQGVDQHGRYAAQPKATYGDRSARVDIGNGLGSIASNLVHSERVKACRASASINGRYIARNYSVCES
jgi:hypothetical protein